MGGFNLQELMSQAKRQYEVLQKKMEETVVEGTSGGGTVVVKMDGRKQVLSMKIDPEARSSMWEDLQRGRRTEVDLLNGEIVRLGAQLDVPTPINQRIVDLVKEAETRGGAPSLPADELSRRVLHS